VRIFEKHIQASANHQSLNQIYQPKNTKINEQQNSAQPQAVKASSKAPTDLLKIASNLSDPNAAKLLASLPGNGFNPASIKLMASVDVQGDKKLPAVDVTGDQKLSSVDVQEDKKLV
jgi:hypothetical protein